MTINNNVDAASKSDPQSSVAPTTVSLLTLANNNSDHSTLELIRIGNDETPIAHFTDQSVEVKLHYCDESEINSYTHCNGNDCILCKIGKKVEKRLLLPVYLPKASCIGVLPISPTLRPYSLLPQLFSILQSDTRSVVFLSREGSKYNVSSSPLPEDVEDGSSTIKAFLESFNNGDIDLTSVYQRIPNEQLAAVDSIKKMMDLKGIRLDESK